jgi:hypothetical protein
MEEAKSHVRLTVKSQEQALSGRALMTKNIIDDETIEACRRGESDAFRLLFEAYKKLFLNCGNKRKERQMKSTLTRSVIPIALLVVLTAVALSKASDHVAITAHEWGTFTSIAGEDGRAMSWRPYGGPTDLPCFVDRWPGSGKGPLAGTVRMETPVLYFYGSRDSRASVKVAFRRGVITEWYPKAALAKSSGDIAWSDVRIAPGAAPEFQREHNRSHYYAARETDAAPLQVGGQSERFLFYRGVGTFPLPLSAKMADDHNILLENLDRHPVQGLIYCENRGGKLRFQFVGTMETKITLDSQTGDGDLSNLLVRLKNRLVDSGLYEKEARAMIETWRDSWFEDGTRSFYIVPRSTVEAVLPLDIQPAPADIARVFVGRLEIITPATIESLK